MSDSQTCARDDCGRPFQPKRPNQKYCSPHCATKVANARRTAPRLEERACDACGRPYQPKRETQRYCNPACAEAAWLERRRAARRELFGRPSAGGYVRTIPDVREGERAFYVADLHYPFPPRGLLVAVEKAMADYQPDRIFYGGDMGDCYGISSFNKNPTRWFDLDDEMAWLRGMLDRHREACPQAQQEWEDGNHEDRLTRYLWKRAGELTNLRVEDTGEPVLSISALLGLKKRGIPYVPFGGRIDYAGFIITHGPVRRAANIKHCAKWMSERVRSSGLCGHFHRNQSFSWVGDRGQSQSWIAMGCLCDLNPEYEPFADWQWGFAYSQVVGGAVHPTLVQPFGGRFQIEGVTYEYEEEP